MAGEVRGVMDEILYCLENKNNFLLSGGAGCGKTYTLIQTLHEIYKKDANSEVACITYTNVAADEIKERSPYSKLHVSTIHDFLWQEIKSYQINLKTVLVEYADNPDISEKSIDSVSYRNYKSLKDGIISHDDLLEISRMMFEKYPLLSKILCDKYDYIFVDEYQDTQESVIKIFLECIKHYSKNKTCIGFFGDSMQSIYDSGVGDIKPYLNDESGDTYVKEIIKSDNFRCSENVINLLNKIRSDIRQKPSKKGNNGEILNEIGSAVFLYSDSLLSLPQLQSMKDFNKWNFNNYETTKILLLTHRLSANQMGFSDIIKSYKGKNNRWFGSDIDALAKHLLKIGGVLYSFEMKNYSHVIDLLERKIESNSDKRNISGTLEKIINDKSQSIEDVIDKFDEIKIITKDENFNRFIADNNEIYDNIKRLPLSQVMDYYIYYNGFSPYSTQHGVKGAEFDNVLVVMDNGRWNKYNFKYYFEGNSAKESVYNRTEKLFYVCCSRAKDNLVIYYPEPSDGSIERAKELFGEDNVKKIG